MKHINIQKFRIVNFRSIEDETFEFHPLTIFTGKNGSGKSTVLNALLFCASFRDMRQVNTPDFDYDSNFTSNQSEIKLFLNDKVVILCKREKDRQSCQTQQIFQFDQNLYYLNADRSPIQSMKLISNTNFKFGKYGEYVEQYFLSNNRQKVANFNGLKIETLDYHIGFWIEKILNLHFDFTAQENQQRIQCGFNSKELKINIDPTRVATGMNYLTKILIVGLSCKKGDVFIVENPEIHLHPQAISNLTEFFAMLVKGGVQVILETHDTRLVSKLRILVNKKELNPNDVIIYYKDNIESHFDAVYINENGFFINSTKDRIPFPQGFMDVDLIELMEVR